MLTESGRHVGETAGRQAEETRVTMRFCSMRVVAAAASAALLIGAADLSHAQSVDPKAGTQRQPTAEGDGQKKIDEFAEAAKLLGGPAANPECVWLGRRVVGLLWRDDLDTAFRHLDLYDRFGCPAGHIQATFRCLVRQGNPDLKTPETLNGRVHACWINPAGEATATTTTTPAPAPAPSAAVPNGTTNR
jgi:hypothetical protein